MNKNAILEADNSRQGSWACGPRRL